MNLEMTFGIVLFVMAVCIVLIIVIIVRQIREKNAVENKESEESLEMFAESTLQPDGEFFDGTVVEPLAVPVPEPVVEQVQSAPDEPVLSATPEMMDNKYYVLLYRDPATDKLGIELPTKSNVLDKSQLTTTELVMVKGFFNKLRKWLDAVPEAEEKSQPVLPPDAPITPISIPVTSTPIENPMSRSIFSLRQETPSDAGLPSIASQINAVLQNILIQENYQGEGFYLTDNVDGDLVIVVGTEKFVGIDNVPDVSIAKLIQRAADLWAEQNLRRKG